MKKFDDLINDIAENRESVTISKRTTSQKIIQSGKTSTLGEVVVTITRDCEGRLVTNKEVYSGLLGCGHSHHYDKHVHECRTHRCKTLICQDCLYCSDCKKKLARQGLLLRFFKTCTSGFISWKKS